MKICFATGNENKLKEISNLLGSTFELISLNELSIDSDLQEDHNTLEKNSEQKARFIFEKFGIPVFADDTGLEIFSLNMEPGVYSARYAGNQKNDEDNIALVLKNLAGRENRKAQFRTVISYIDNNIFKQFEGVIEGEIITELRGDNGFGYDPIFVPDNYSKTFAELSMEEKNKISHRGRAFSLLISFLKQRYADA